MGKSSAPVPPISQRATGTPAHKYMAVFNVSNFSKKTAGSSQDYSVLVDQLSVLEAQLSADGKLSPGDYKMLIAKGQELYGHPGLTPANRAAIQVKVANWQSQSSQSQLKDSQDITRLNNEAKDDVAQNSMYLGNNPTAFLKAQAASQNAKIAALSEAINQLDASGQDSSAHMNEYQQALNDYSDTLEALKVVENHQPGQAPSSDQAAYITTNSRGEITNVQVGREGSKSGYLETNGLYGGLKIYGKLNKKDNGKNVFLLGNKTFSGTDVVVPGPDGTLKPQVLQDTSQIKQAGPYAIGASGYSDVDPAGLRTQSAIPAGAYGKGSNGFLYKNNGDGSYTKYTNADATKMGIADNDIIALPKSYEQSIIPQVKQTQDMSTVAPTLPAPTSFAIPQSGPGSASVPTNLPQPNITNAPAGHPAATAPTERAPQTPQGIAGGVIGAAKGFMAKVFAGGK